MGKTNANGSWGALEFSRIGRMLLRRPLAISQKASIVDEVNDFTA